MIVLKQGVNNDRIFIFGQTNPVKLFFFSFLMQVLYKVIHKQNQGYSNL